MLDTFTNIYDKQIWGKGLGSGRGSNPEYCKKYLNFLSSLFNEPVKVVDLGCGDMQLYEGFDFKEANYVGVDIVASVIAENRIRYPKLTFIRDNFLDPEFIKRMAAYEPDIILIKDVFQHWEDIDIRAWLNTAVTELAPPYKIVAANGPRHFRKPEKNAFPRDLNNRWHWAPVDMTRFGFRELFHYPRGKYKQVAILEA